MARSLNALAKRVYNRAPDRVALTFADGRRETFEPHTAEFFGDRLQCEVRSPDDPGAAFRLVTEGDSLLVGRRGPDADGWTSHGVVTAVDPA